MRHSLAFDLAQSGTRPGVIQRQLGHSSLAITDRYVNHLMPAEVIEAVRGRDWAN